MESAQKRAPSAVNPTRGEQLADLTGAPRAPYLVGGQPPPRYEYRDTTALHVSELEPARTERRRHGVATDPVGIVLMVALTVALVLVAAGEFTVAYYLARTIGA